MSGRCAPFVDFDIRGLNPGDRDAFWNGAERALAALANKWGPRFLELENMFAANCLNRLVLMRRRIVAGEPPLTLSDRNKVCEFNGHAIDLNDLWFAGTHPTDRPTPKLPGLPWWDASDVSSDLQVVLTAVAHALSGNWSAPEHLERIAPSYCHAVPGHKVKIEYRAEGMHPGPKPIYAITITGPRVEGTWYFTPGKLANLIDAIRIDD